MKFIRRLLNGWSFIFSKLRALTMPNVIVIIRFRTIWFHFFHYQFWLDYSLNLYVNCAVFCVFLIYWLKFEVNYSHSLLCYTKKTHCVNLNLKFNVHEIQFPCVMYRVDNFCFCGTTFQILQNQHRYQSKMLSVTILVGSAAPSFDLIES